MNTSNNNIPSLIFVNEQTNPSTSSPTLSAKPVSNWEIAKVVLIDNFQESIHPFLKTLCYFIAHKLTLGTTSKRFKAKFAYTAHDLLFIWSKSYFKTDLISDPQGNPYKARNIAKLNILEKEKDLEQSKILRTQVTQSLITLTNRPTLVENSLRPLSHTISDGICRGISIDIAQKPLSDRLEINETKLINVIKQGEDGASSEAAANQAVKECMPYLSKDSIEQELMNFTDSLTQLSKMEEIDPFFEIDFNIVKGILLSLYPNLPVVQQPNSLKSSNIKDIVDEIILSDRSIVNRPSDFERSVNKKIDEIYEQRHLQLGEDDERSTQDSANNRRVIAWVVGLLQLYQAKMDDEGIRNDVIRYTYKHWYSEAMNKFQLDPICKSRNLQRVSTDPILGNHVMYKDDESRLIHLEKLNPGVYETQFNIGKTGGHVITYVKISDENNYILDPNGFQIKCGNASNVREKILKLLAFYESPNKSHVFYDSRQTEKFNHQVTIYKYEHCNR